VAVWAVARWQFDGTAFLGKMIGYDIVTRIGQPIDEHAGSALFYLGVLQRHQYEWLAVAAAALALAWPGLAAARRWVASGAEARGTAIVLGAWAAASIVIPSMIATKTQWYLNSFYPLFAILVALAIGHALDTLRHAGRTTAAGALTALVAVAVIVAEGKMAWRSFGQVDLGRSPQQLLLRQAPRLSGARVFAATCPHPEAFLARAAGAVCVATGEPGSPGGEPAPGDYVLTRGPSDPPGGLRLVDRNDASALYQRQP
jgi:hypothetical protein